MKIESLLCKIEDCTVAIYKRVNNMLAMSVNGMMIVNANRVDNLDPIYGNNMNVYIKSQVPKFDGKEYDDKPRAKFYHMNVYIFEDRRDG